MDRLSELKDWVVKNPAIITRLTAALVALTGMGMVALRIIRPDEYALILKSLGF